MERHGWCIWITDLVSSFNALDDSIHESNKPPLYRARINRIIVMIFLTELLLCSTTNRSLHIFLRRLIGSPEKRLNRIVFVSPLWFGFAKFNCYNHCNYWLINSSMWNNAFCFFEQYKLVSVNDRNKTRKWVFLLCLFVFKSWNNFANRFINNFT